MKKINFYTSLATLALVFFMSVSSIASSWTVNGVDGETSVSASDRASAKIAAVASIVSEKTKFSYLRFDVNKFIKRNVSGFIHSSLDYLRFNVNEFVETSEPVIAELPASNEYDYLRFDATRFADGESALLPEMPAADFNYLKFDVNNFTGSEADESIEMPANDFDYLRFDVSKYSNTSAVSELPVTE